MKFLSALMSSLMMIILFSHCQFQFQEIVDKPLSKSELAFVCELKNNWQQNIAYITYTSNIGEAIKWDLNPTNSQLYFNALNGVSAEIYENGKFFKKFDNRFQYTYTIDGLTNFDYGKEYTLKVYKEGYDSVIGKQTFPRNYFIDSNRIKLIKNDSFLNKTFAGLKLNELVFEIDDSIKEKNVYTFRAEITNLHTDKNPNNIIVKNLPLYTIDKNQVFENLLDDSTFNGKKYFWHVGVILDSTTLSRSFPPLKDQKISITIYFKSTSPDYILYLKGLLNSGGASSNNPNAEPISPYYNMKGGAGLFICSGQEYRIEIPVNY